MNATKRELWAEARRLVVQENATYEEAAAETGLSLSTLQKRAGREGWQEQKGASFGYAQTIRRLKSIALRKALEAVEAAETADEMARATQLLYAWQKTEQAYPEHRYKPAEESPALRLQVTVEVIEELVAWLDEHDRNALMALQPQIAPFAAHMEAKHAA